MKKFEAYQDAKRQQGYSTSWAGMLGKPYHGGGGGVGKLVYLNLSDLDMKTPTIYFQYSNGDKNYHECPRSLLPYLDAAIRDSFSALLATALQKQEADLKAAAAAALVERNELEAACASE